MDLLGARKPPPKKCAPRVRHSFRNKVGTKLVG